MKCTNCGFEVSNTEKFCSNCGESNPNYTPPQQQVQTYQQENYMQGNNSNKTDTKEKTDGLALAGFILGIVGLVAWFLPLAGYPVTIVGIVLSSKGMASKNKKALAIVGLILSIIGLVATVINSILGVLQTL